MSSHQYAESSSRLLHTPSLATDQNAHGADAQQDHRRRLGRDHLVLAELVRRDVEQRLVVVPAETRRLFNIHEGDELAIAVESDAITLRKLEATCVFCASREDVKPFRGRGVCVSCRSELTG